MTRPKPLPSSTPSARILEMYHGDRPSFHERIRHAWRTLGPRVTAARMVRDYTTEVYQPSLARTRS